jgi:hypothetical protein
MAEDWSTRTKPDGTNEFLLKEDAFHLLLEDGSKIVLVYGEDWSIRTKPE